MRLPRLLVFFAVVAAAFSILATPAGARSSSETHRLIHEQLVRYYHADGYIKAIGHVAYRTIYHPNHRIKTKWQRAVRYLIHVRADAHRRIVLLRAPPVAACGASTAACAWYADGATQCEVSHEGGFTTDTNPTYKGRFQMDYSFETATPFGRAMEARYGRASHWPAGAQIAHAYSMWLVRGWGPWPPYYDYGCSAYHGSSYP